MLNVSLVSDHIWCPTMFGVILETDELVFG